VKLSGASSTPSIDGTVTFTDTYLGVTTTLASNVPLNPDGNTATFTPPEALIDGDHFITAVFNGDATFAASTSAVLEILVNEGPGS
jgi:hypothetical protein